MTDLVAFVRARLDEDEAAAKGAAEQSAEEGTRWWFDNATPETPREFHVARHDPARVLREVKAKRTIVTIYTEQNGRELPPGVHDGRDPDERECDQALLNAFGDILRILGEAYGDHPDYRPEWKWNL